MFIASMPKSATGLVKRIEVMVIMPKVIVALVKHLFENFGFERIFAIPFKSNIASARTLEKAGFIREALIKKGVIKNGVLLDYYIYSILKNR